MVTIHQPVSLRYQTLFGRATTNPPRTIRDPNPWEYRVWYGHWESQDRIFYGFAPRQAAYGTEGYRFESCLVYFRKGHPRGVALSSFLMAVTALTAFAPKIEAARKAEAPRGRG